MGQNTVGLARGMNAALDELEQHKKEKRRKYKTVQDYLDKMIEMGNVHVNIKPPNDPRRLWMYNRAASIFRESHEKKYIYSLTTVDDMVSYIEEHGEKEWRKRSPSKDINRQKMEEEAWKIYRNKKLADTK